ncbi:aldo/keto reductase [Microbacterium sp. AK031]|uniref:aldo/keto reductase n=1 Tax=Microbacterium sp. AK031 TaxID=2723076 RepID=UPI002169B2A1|nr:aldo/keto reductase [Microbacterium sp. AK031]MCS3843646.1 aryl-alcohol dehydrogenase-like predicted oxidoreductase [Microbacterium sp. AK031]
MRTELPVIPLGRTDLKITRVGLGAWAVGGPRRGDWAFGWGPQDDDDSVGTIRSAIERGVNWIDTAAIYGLGHSETIVGRVVRDFAGPDRPYIFTKGGVVWDDADPSQPSRRVANAASLRAEVNASLRRLGVEQIDLYQVHWPAENGTPVEEYWQAMLDIQQSGKARWVGLSNHSVPQLTAAAHLGRVASLQPKFSAIATQSASDVLPWCDQNGTGAIVYSPMGSGLLSGAFTATRVAGLPDDDWRKQSEDFTTNLDRNLAIGAALGKIAERHGVPQAAAAVAWTLGFRGVTGAIVGARRPAQVDDWLPAASLHLTAEDYAEVRAAGAGAVPA